MPSGRGHTRMVIEIVMSSGPIDYLISFLASRPQAPLPTFRESEGLRGRSRAASWSSTAMGLLAGVIMQVPLGGKMVEPRARACANMSWSCGAAAAGSIEAT
jgi:hypothetical protein